MTQRQDSGPLAAAPGAAPSARERAPEALADRDQPHARRGWLLALRTFTESKLGTVGVAILLFFVLFSFAGPLVYHSDQTQGNLLGTDLPPGAGHPLGTDASGYDELGRLMLGGQASLEIGLFAALIAICIGVLYGAIAGMTGGILDGLMMRFVDILLSIPFLLVVLLLATKYRANILSLSLIIGFFSWLVPARLVRGEVLTLRGRDFVHASRMLGASDLHTVVRHLIPNAISVVVVNLTFQVADAIIAIAFLGFLGLGLPFPHTDWGDMLANAETYLTDGYWWLVYPVGISLILVVMACNFIGDAWRDALDVRLRER
jgi:ABC-type dipeptide/oligopeptide/nickel transport system permease subunit